jgi:hypothetical protein
MIREPFQIPATRGVYALINRRRRYAYVAFTQNLQKRSHSMSHMLLAHDLDPMSYWPVKDLPKHASDEYVFTVVDEGCPVEKSMSVIALAERGFAAKNYTIVGGHRAASPIIAFQGRRMSLVEAIRASGSKVKYLTAYRRIERGWSVRQALGIDPPDPRWHQDLQEARRARAKEAA